jgi:hypothetical protein
MRYLFPLILLFILQWGIVAVVTYTAASSANNLWSNIAEKVQNVR